MSYYVDLLLLFVAFVVYIYQKCNCYFVFERMQICTCHSDEN